MCVSLYLQADDNSPEKFVGIVLREKTPESLLRELLAIYSGEVKELNFFLRESCSEYKALATTR